MDSTTSVGGAGGLDYIYTPNDNSLPPTADTVARDAGATTQQELTMDDLFKANPHLKECFDKLERVLSDPKLSEGDVFSMQDLIRALIDLGQTLQLIATAYADTLTKVTEKMNAYSKKMTQIPVVTVDEAGGKQEAASYRTQLFSNMLESVRTNKGMEEDQAKKIQTMLQQLKDAGQSANDFLGTFLDLFRGISQKINR